MKEVHELEVTERSGFIRPLVSADDAVAQFNEYQQLKKKLRGDGDFISFTDRQGNRKEHPTKQWRSKLTRFFGIAIDVVNEEMKLLPDNSFVVNIQVRATAPNGMSMLGDGSCWSKIKTDTDRHGKAVDIYHNTRSHAYTRAKNRAVLELVGFGEVSAEEITGEYDDHPKNNKSSGPKNPDAPSTDKQRKFMFALAKDKNVDNEELHRMVKERTGKESSKDLTMAEVSSLIDDLKAM